MWNHIQGGTYRLGAVLFGHEGEEPKWTGPGQWPLDLGTQIVTSGREGMQAMAGDSKALDR